MVAVISDIHANLEALEAVLRSIGSQGVDELWCLGDLVGYGPDPEHCVDLVARNCTLSLMGNHDWAVLNSPIGFNSVAARMVYWTKERMQVDEESAPAERERWEYLFELPLQSVQGSYLLVHASPRAALSEYVLPTDVDYDRGKLYDIFGLVGQYCLVGHSHVPCCITEDLEIILPQDSTFELQLDERKAVVNTGSVGQPRDGDARACYITLDVEQRVITYHRVPYEAQKTTEKLNALGGDYEMLASRLLIGR